MAKKLVGHMTCPECDFADADVGEDKNGHLYRHCTECNGQFFTHGDPTRTANMKKKMRPIAVGDPAPTPSPAPTPPRKKGALEEYMEKNK
jgi:hypothetical protein